MRKPATPPLTETQKWEIFRKDEQGVNRKELAKEYDRSIDTINNVCAAMMGEVLKRYKQNLTKNKSNEPTRETTT